MDTKRLDLNLLLALEALLAERNVTRAAQRLNLSQPALSAQLARLRVLFSDQLFVPTSRGVLPTARALELQGPLQEALDRARELVGAKDVFDPETSRLSFSLAGSDYMQVVALLPFILGLRSSAPRLKALVRLTDSRTYAAELEGGETDLAFLQPERVDRGLHSQVLFEEAYVGIARKGATPDGTMSLDRFTASGHAIVSPRGEGFRGPTDTALAAIGQERHVCLAVSSFVFLVEAVSQSDLIALAPRRLARTYRDRLDIFAPPVTVPGFSIAMAWHDRTHHHSGHRWLRDRLARHCAALA